MMKFDLKGRVTRLLYTAAVMLVPIAVFAAEESIGKKATRLAGEANGIVVLLLTLAQLAALFFMWSGISKIRKDKEQPGQGLMQQGMVGCAIAVALYFLPRMIGMGEATIFP